MRLSSLGSCVAAFVFMIVLITLSSNVDFLVIPSLQNPMLFWGTEAQRPLRTNIAFIKVFKASSTTVSNLLARFALSRDLNVALPEKNKTDDQWAFHCFGEFKRYKVIPLAKGHHYNLVYNHMIYNRSELEATLPNNTFYFASIREPTSRFLSALYYYKYLPLPKVNNTKGDQFTRFSQSFQPNSTLEKDFRTYNAFAQTTGMSLKSINDVTAIQKHAGRLDKEIDVVLVTERFAQSLILLKRLSGLSIKDVIYLKTNSRQNRNQHRITEKHLRLIKKWQLADEILYKHFTARFQKQVDNEGPSFNEEVEFFENLIQKVSKFCLWLPEKVDAHTDSKHLILSIEPSKWTEEFQVNSTDCKLMKMQETDLQELMIKWTIHKRDLFGYKPDLNRHVPPWKPNC